MDVGDECDWITLTLISRFDCLSKILSNGTANGFESRSALCGKL